MGPYVLGPLLGRGGMAVVHEATHATTGRIVALKLISPHLAGPDFAERFRREGRMQAALDHPNIVTVYEAGSSEYGPWLAMRLVNGTTLTHLIDDGLLSAARAVEIVDQVAGALDAAHAAGLVHRDVKPRNILVADDGTAYLADFGLSRPSDGAGATVTGQYMGTLAYAAPEVLRGADAGPAADRYALAAVLFECLTASAVFPRSTHAAVMFAHTNEPPPRVSGRRAGAPAALDAALIAGLAKDPDARPATARGLVARARAALGDTDLGPPPPRVLAAADDDQTTGETLPVLSGTAPQRAPTTATRRLAAFALTAIVAALAGGGVVAALGRDNGDSTSALVDLPAAPAGSVRLGSDLARPGRAVDCRGVPVADASPSCTIFQDRTAGAELVVPRNGVVRRWAVRFATGEFALSVVRRRDAGYFQTARSRNEFVGSDAPHAFATDLAVEQGDRLALVVVEGSGAGIADAPAGTIGRWKPPLRGAITAPKAGASGELLLRVDYVPGGKQRAPVALTGAAAAAAPEGTLLARRRALPTAATPLDVRIELVAGHGILDLVRDDRRIARIAVPGLSAPAGDLLQVVTVPEPDVPGQLGIDVRFNRPDSDRLVRHYYDFTPGGGLQFIN